MEERGNCFGENLKTLRKRAGYTRSQLAELIAYSPKSIDKWESGASVPVLDTVCKIADLFGVSVDSLVRYQNTQIKYLLGIDGGGTKTEFLLTDMSGKEIKRVILGPSNYVDIGMQSTLNILWEGVTQVCGGIDKREISVFAGLAGGVGTENERKINKFLYNFGFEKVGNDADTENALEIALNGDDGIVVIMGTGVIAFVQHGGKCWRIGGWGYLIDRGGSGYNFGSDAIEAAYKYFDGRDGSEIIFEIIQERTGKSFPDFISDIYSGGKAYIASFADVVFRAFEEGDRYAENIIMRNVNEVCEMIKIGRNIIGKKRPKTVICGGLCQRKEILACFFEKCLGKEAVPEFLEEPMVNGAILLAKKNAERK